MYVCHFCGNQRKKQVYIAREMMFGTRDRFEYLECANCGGLQIASIPDNMSQYYPHSYYSFNYTRDDTLKRYLKRMRFQYSFTKRGTLGKILVKRFGTTPLAQWLLPTGMDKGDPILDVGCGNGSVITQLHDVGFMNLTGIDPYIEKDNTLDDGLQILKRDIFNIEGTFKLIMFHHSLEHVDSPFDHIRAAWKLLEQGQWLLIRAPVVGGYAWRKYSTDWVQIDAPRHFAIPTTTSMEILAERTGFTVEKEVYDSSAFQFWGSEQYKHDISLNDSRSYEVSPGDSMFTEKDMDDFIALATRLNNERDGDQACFYLRKKPGA